CLRTADPVGTARDTPHTVIKTSRVLMAREPRRLVKQAAELIDLLVELAFRPASKAFILRSPELTLVRAEPVSRTFPAASKSFGEERRRCTIARRMRSPDS